MSDTTDDFRSLCGDTCYAALMAPAPARRVMVSLREDDLSYLQREFPGCTPSQAVEAVIDAWLIETLAHSLERARARVLLVGTFDTTGDNDVPIGVPAPR